MIYLRTFYWTFLGLLSFWRRNPLSFATLLVGLSVATALWSGVQALNAEARQSYNQAAAALGADQFRTLVPLTGETVSQSAFVDLRRAGWFASPVVEGTLRIDGKRIRVIGIDPVTLPSAETTENAWLEAFSNTSDSVLTFLTPPFRAFAHPSTLEQMGWLPGRSIQLSDTSILPPISELDALAPRTILTDIGVAQQLLNLENEISRLILDEQQKVSDATLTPLIEGLLRVRNPTQNTELSDLTDSFHLNLTAFGFLSFVVGLFIVNSAVGLAFENRRSMVRTFRACGVSSSMLAAALIVELFAITLIAGTAGILLGYLIASALLPNVAASLEGLYGARIAGTLTLEWHWWISGLAMAVVGAFFATSANLAKLIRMPILANAHPFAWREAGRRMRRWQLILAGTLALAGICAFFYGGSLIVGFALMGAVLLAAALVLPSILASVLIVCERQSKRPMLQWFWADSVQQMSGLSLALMALLLALSINVGVGTMVQSFRSAFLGWLDQRLAADIYLNTGTQEETEKVLAYLNKAPGVEAILPVWNANSSFREWPIEIFGFQDHKVYREKWPLLESTRTVWRDIADGKGLLISEQFARKFDLTVGTDIDLQSEIGVLKFSISGIYSDYGNPIGQAMISNQGFVDAWPSAQKTRFAVMVRPDRKSGILNELGQRFDFQEGRLIDQEALKGVSKSIFERTFAVTLALNALTLAVAGIAMLTNLLSLSQMRLPQLAPVWAMGITRKNLGYIELMKAMALALITSLLALPLGLIVAWILLTIINVEAFGWRLPMLLFPLDWLKLICLAIFTAFLAAAYPAYRLRKMPPTELLKVFANER